MTNKERRQWEENRVCDYEWESVVNEWEFDINPPVTQLRSSNARVVELRNYFVLVSYNAAVAAINIHTGVLYDMLRKVYGYTATSAQHIAKFANDYNATDIMRWREV